MRWKYRNITDVLQKSRNDDIGHICEEMLLEFDIAILILAEIDKQFLDLIAESNRVRIIGHVIKPTLDFVEQTVGVFFVAVIEEVLSLFLNLVPFVGRFVVENVPFLLETPANESIKTFPPICELE